MKNTLDNTSPAAGTAAPYWRCRDRILTLERPLIMGILNVTPNSFSDGGRHNSPAAAVAYGLQLVEEGTDILDIGGESTHPGAAPVTVEEEIARVEDVIRELSGRPIRRSPSTRATPRLHARPSRRGP